MTNKTKIEWADVTWSPVTGCTSISPGCLNCYARRISKRLAGRYGYPEDEPFRVTLHPERLQEPLHWKKPRRVFVNSMGDLFHDQVPEGYVDSILEIIAACPQHIFLVLTKRPENINQKIYEPTNEVPFRELGGGDYLPNLWLGVSVENQQAADERIPILLQTPAAVRFVSVEPMLEEVDLTKINQGGDVWINALTGDLKSYHSYGGVRTVKVAFPYLDWVICAGEIGPNARPCYPDWVRSLRDQCQAEATPFFFKSWGEYCTPSQMPEPTYRAWNLQYDGETLRSDSAFTFSGNYDDSAWDNSVWRVGKKAAGRLLDGRTWNEFPEVENG